MAAVPCAVEGCVYPGEVVVVTLFAPDRGECRGVRRAALCEGHRGRVMQALMREMPHQPNVEGGD